MCCPEGEHLSPTRRSLTIVGTGAAAGAVSGLLGVGGGVVMIPLLAVFVRFTQRHAHATSLAAIIPIAAVGAIGFALRDDVGVLIAVTMGAGALVGAPLGAAALARVSDRSLTIAFTVLQIAVGLQMLLS
ncbi:MAG: TSUP family transporter [Actinobacteria bacterium]|nr:TSUP family transporter [Actinomycetota bacterium]